MLIKFDYFRLCDPPGQKSVYIPPGDTSQESYRLSTFLRFPQTAAVNPSELAFVGFFFTGYKDRVKCFVCGLSVEGWMVGDDPRDFRWHQPNCALVKGEESGNKQIGAGMFRFSFCFPGTKSNFLFVYCMKRFFGTTNKKIIYGHYYLGVFFFA